MSDRGGPRGTAHGEDREGIGSTVLSCVFAVVIGGVVGLVTTFAHAQLPPWGLLAGLAILLALVVGFRLVFASRLVGGAAAVGFFLGSALLAFPAAGAPILTLTSATGWIWALGSVVLAVAALVPPWRGRVSARP